MITRRAMRATTTQMIAIQFDKFFVSNIASIIFLTFLIIALHAVRTTKDMGSVLLIVFGNF
jgi:hypothetical protein